VDSTNSTSPTSAPRLSTRRRRIAGLWASALVALHFTSVAAQTFGSAAAGVEVKVVQCGPISDTIEYLLWLLRQL